MKTGIELIAEERRRQIEVEGWTKASDSRYTNGELAAAAISYACPSDLRSCKVIRNGNKLPLYWPWDEKWWKPTPDNRIKELSKAGALIAAEIDRLNSEDKLEQDYERHNSQHNDNAF